jgi:parvulin-like peptidyl-prolyl isomerase
MAPKILTLSLAFALAGGLVPAQKQEAQPQEAAKATAKAAPAAGPQDPQKPAEIDRLDELRSQLERAKAELDATRKMVASGGLPARVLPTLSGRELKPRVLDLGVDAIPQPVAAEAGPQKPTGVRLLGDGERERFGPDVIATVDGEPIRKAEFDDVLGYFASRPNVESEEQNKREALRALVIQKAALAHFGDAAVAAKEKIVGIQKQIADGADFAAVARASSQCPSAAQGGDLGPFGRGMMDPMFEMAAFQTKVGQTSGIVQSGFGYHLIKVTGEEKAEGKVRASHILVMFDEDQQAVRQAMMAAMSGQVDLAFASDDWRKISPF